MLSILTCLTFYLPTESGEKVSLGLTVLLAFSVFMLLIAESMPATSDSIPLIGKLFSLTKYLIKFSSFFKGIYFTLVMSLTSLSVLLAVVLLNIHLYGSALKPVPPRLRYILFCHVAPFLRVKLHRGTRSENQKQHRHSSAITPRRATTIYNAVFLNENDILSNGQQSQQNHTFQSTTINENNLNSDSSSISNIQSSSNSLGECKRLLTELNRLILRPTDLHEEEMIVRDWQNVALVMDRCLFFLYIFLTTVLTIGTLIIAPLLKIVPKPPNYHQLNITRD
jgi:nicotinic acetylcholine receptor